MQMLDHCATAGLVPRRAPTITHVHNPTTPPLPTTAERRMTVVTRALSAFEDAEMGLVGTEYSGPDLLQCGHCGIILHLHPGIAPPLPQRIWCQNCGAVNRP